MAHKIVESERSPSVTSANWKEHILLQKQMHLLGKNERTVSHRISVEQKVLCKRFQWKLRQSKLHHARIKQDKDMERDIRQTKLFTFNTNVGFEDENDESLRKIWARGKQEVAAGRCASSRGRGTLGASLFKKWESISIGDESDEEETRAKPAARRPYTAVSMATPVLKPRPVSAFPLTSKPCNDRLDLNLKKNAPAVYIETPGKSHASGALDNDANDNGEDDECDGTSRDSHDADLTLNKQPAPSTGARLKPRAKSTHPGSFLSVVIGSSSRPVSASSRTGGRSGAKSATPTPAANIFSTEKKPTLLDLHRERMRSADYESRIRSFGDSVQCLQADQSYLSDYYTMRLIQNSLSSKKPNIRLPGTPLSDYKRNVGNVAIRPMTLKALDYNFDHRPSNSMNIPCF